jgi:predicted double-glycine peptidase
VLLPQIKELTEVLAHKAKESHESYLDRVIKSIAPKFTAAHIGQEFELNLQDEKGPMVVVSKDPIQHKYPVVRHLPGSL